jgi:FemAB-related protein (PEP-CTERM system-associated)
MITATICEDPVLWDSFVESMPEASNYHRWIWRRVIQETYGHRSYYLAAMSSGNILGVLPLVFVKSRLFSNSLVSMPFFSYGGVLASSDAAREVLLTKAAELGRDLRARCIELRQDVGGAPNWQDVSAKVTMEVRIPAAAGDMWDRLNPKIRKRIRYARKNGLAVRWGGGEAVNEFYEVFATNMRNLGTPVYPRAWFANMAKYLPGEVRFLLVSDEGRPAAAGLVCLFRDSLELPWAASLPDTREKFSPLLLYWTLLEWAAENGFRRVDLGRCTPGSGNHQFKHHWGCVEKPLHWSYWLPAGATVPVRHAESGRLRWAIKMWRRLPLAVANAVGPRIVRGIP